MVDELEPALFEVEAKGPCLHVVKLYKPAAAGKLVLPKLAPQMLQGPTRTAPPGEKISSSIPVCCHW